MAYGRVGSAGAGPKRKRRATVLWTVVAILGAFLAGFGWQWYEAGQVRDQLESTESELRVQRLQLLLAQAALTAEAGSYEAARSQMSDFFTRAQEQRDLLPPALAAEVDGLLTSRDEVITGLSRSDDRYADVLFGMLERFRAAMGRSPLHGSAPGSPAAPAGGGSPGALPGSDPGAEPGSGSAPPGATGG